MTGAWCVLGLISGTNVGMQKTGMVAIISHQIAGVLVFLPLGILLGLFANRAKASLAGAACGALAGLLFAPLVTALPRGEAINLAFVMGGLVGATCWPWIRAAETVFEILFRLARRLG